MKNDKNFVELIDETVDTLREIGATEGKDFERATKQSWDYDCNERRATFVGGFKEFRQHVRNVLDAE